MTDALTSRDVLDCLHGRWPDDQYLFIEEAPQNSARQGRKIDALVVSLWASRGHEIDAVEVKVSMSDFKRELDGYVDPRGKKHGGPEKADWWWHHCNRYWIACPVKIAPKIQELLPEAWGLLAVEDGKCRVVVKAPKHPAEPFDWMESIGLMRAAANAGVNALERSRSSGYSQGFDAGKKSAGYEQGAERLQGSLESLQAVVNTYKDATGIDLNACYGSVAEARRIGDAAYLVMDALRDPKHLFSQLDRQAAGLTAAGAGIAATRERLRELFGATDA